MAVRMAYDPADQRKRRRRALLSQQEVGDQFSPPISDTKVSEYERGGALPYEFTGEDYEVALAKAIVAAQDGAA